MNLGTYIFPELGCSSNDCVCCRFGLASLVVSLGNLSNILYGHVFPNTIWSEYQNLFILFEHKMLNLRLRCYTKFMSVAVSKTSRYMQSDQILITCEHSERILLLSISSSLWGSWLWSSFFHWGLLWGRWFCNYIRYSTATSLNPIFFAFSPRNMVFRQNPYLSKLTDRYGLWVSDISGN